ncbi:hypothetical protein PG985_002462 [Apiospora marii]|uniref:uncharacterized protein n=1 Tax=Apiospora marii TaxID=335849 RepID=UPI00312E079A
MNLTTASAPTPSLGLTQMALQTPNPTAGLTMATVPSPVLIPAQPSDDGSGPSKRAPSCGNLADSGNFTFDFQDIKRLMRGARTEPHDPRPMPFLSPYHRFWFSDGIEAANSQSSGKLVLQYLQPAMDMDDGTNMSAIFSTGPKQTTECLAFDFYSIRLGCSSAESECIFTLKGLRLDAEVAAEVVHVPACPSSDCSLKHVPVINFTSLTSVAISLKAQDEDQMWWADELALGWSNNDCEQAACRSQVHDTIRSRDWMVAGKKWRRGM